MIKIAFRNGYKCKNRSEFVKIYDQYFIILMGKYKVKILKVKKLTKKLIIKRVIECGLLH